MNLIAYLPQAALLLGVSAAPLACLGMLAEDLRFGASQAHHLASANAVAAALSRFRRPRLSVTGPSAKVSPFLPRRLPREASRPSRPRSHRSAAAA
jgi:hypothetical protein